MPSSEREPEGWGAGGRRLTAPARTPVTDFESALTGEGGVRLKLIGHAAKIRAIFFKLKWL